MLRMKHPMIFSFFCVLAILGIVALFCAPLAKSQGNPVITFDSLRPLGWTPGQDAIPYLEQAREILRNTGGIIWLPEGDVYLSRRFDLPRSTRHGPSRVVVNLYGQGPDATKLKALPNFPSPEDGMIGIEMPDPNEEILQGDLPHLHQVIKGMRIELPEAANSVAFRWKYVPDIPYRNQVLLALQLEDLVVYPTHPEQVTGFRIEGLARALHVTNVWGDPNRWNPESHLDFTLFVFDYEDVSGKTLDANEHPGCAQCTFRDSGDVLTRSGNALFARGRFHEGVFENVYINGGIDGPGLWLINSYMTRLTNIAAEGRSDRRFGEVMLTNSHHITIDTLELGFPDETYDGAGYGHGLILEKGSSRNTINHVTTWLGRRHWPEGKSAIYVDETSSDNVFERIYLDPSEVTDLYVPDPNDPSADEANTFELKGRVVKDNAFMSLD